MARLWRDNFAGAAGSAINPSYVVGISRSKTDPPTLTGNGGVQTDSPDGGSYAVQDLGVADVDLVIGGTWSTQTWRNWSLVARVQTPLTFGTTSDFESILNTGYQLDLRNWEVVNLFRNGSTVATATQASFAGNFRMRLRVQGANVRARWWVLGEPEPAAWAIDYTDGSPLAAGAFGFGGSGSANRAVVQLAPFQADDFGPSLPDLDIEVGPTRNRDRVTIGPTRRSLEVGPTRSSFTIGPTRERG